MLLHLCNIYDSMHDCAIHNRHGCGVDKRETVWNLGAELLGCVECRCIRSMLQRYHPVTHVEMCYICTDTSNNTGALVAELIGSCVNNANCDEYVL